MYCLFREISGFHGGKYKDDSLQGHSPLCIVDVHRLFRSAYCLHHEGPDDTGSMHL